MNQAKGYTFIGEDLVITGEIRNGGTVDIRGAVDGKIGAERVVIHSGGRFNGMLTAESAEVQGLLQGIVSVKRLLSVGDTGIVRGDVRYGRIAMSEGGELSAELRNVPPDIQGDFQVVVRRGKSVVITVADISAYDPDDPAGSLTFQVESCSGGHVARIDAPGQPADRFTQAELLAGTIAFQHGGASGDEATFEVRVVDKAGASSERRTVLVKVV